MPRKRPELNKREKGERKDRKKFAEERKTNCTRPQKQTKSSQETPKAD